jgi:hypothetical protein
MSSIAKHNLQLAAAIALAGITLLIVLVSGLYYYHRYRRRQQTIPLFEHLETQSQKPHLSIMFHRTPLLPKLELDDMGTAFEPISLKYDNKSTTVPPLLHLSKMYTLPTYLPGSPDARYESTVHLAAAGGVVRRQSGCGDILAFPLPTASTDVRLYLAKQERSMERTHNNLFGRQVAAMMDTSSISTEPIRLLSMASVDDCGIGFSPSMQILPQCSSQKQIPASQTCPARSLIIATPLKAILSCPKITSSTDFPDCTTLLPLSTGIAPESSVGEHELSLPVSTDDATDSKGMRPTTHSYRVWLTNLPRPARTTADMQVDLNKRRVMKTAMWRKLKSPVSNEVLVGDEHEGQSREVGSNGGVATHGKQEEEEELQVPHMSTAEGIAHTSTTATHDVPLIVTDIQFQPFHAQTFSSIADIQSATPAPACKDASESIGPHFPSISNRTPIQIQNESQEQPALGLSLFDFVFDTESPNLDFHLDFAVRLNLGVGMVAINKANAERVMNKPLQPAMSFETVAYRSPPILEAMSDSDELSLKRSEPMALVPPLPSTRGDLGEMKCTAKMYTPRIPRSEVHKPRAPSSHSSSGSSSSSASMLSWLPIREPLTPRFNHLRAVLEGNTNGLEEALPQWPPGVKIVQGG